MTAWRAFSLSVARRTMAAMTQDERALMAFEEQRPRNDRTKEAAIRTAFGISWVRYQQLLLRLVQRPDVLEEYAVTAHRVQRVAADGAAARARRSFRP